MAYSQQQQNDYIDQTAQNTKDEADRVAAADKQTVADQKIDEVTKEAADEVSKIQSDAQK